MAMPRPIDHRCRLRKKPAGTGSNRALQSWYKNQQMSSLESSQRREVRYEPDEKPPRLLSLGLGFQYVLLSISGIVLMPAIIIRAARAGESYLTWAVFAALCICGITTILQAVRIGRVGAGYILLMGTSGTFTAVSVTALVQGGPGLLATLVVASSLFQFALAARLALLRRLITPFVAGTVIMLISVTIMPIAFGMLANVPDGTPASGAPASAAATMICTVGLAILAKGVWRLWAPVIGVAAGCMVAAFYGIFDTTRIAEAAWIGFPTSGWPGLELDLGPAFWTLLPIFVLVTVVGAIETVGDSIGIQQVSWRRPRATDFRTVQGAVSADGVGNLLSGLAGTVPNTTYSSSIAIAELTGVASRTVGVHIGILFLAAAFLPKATGAILAIPDPVAAAYITVIMAMLFVLGMRIAVQDGIDYRKSVVVGVAFWLGVGFQNQQVFADLLGDSSAAVLENGMAAGGIAAILMTLVMELASPRRRRVKAKLELESLPIIDKFVQELASDRNWGPVATTRLRAAAEEALLSLLPEEGTSEPDHGRHLLLVARGDRRSVELEFFASAMEQNLEDRLTLLGHWTERSGASEFSLRLLRHYASSVRHQQYFDTDIITVRVDGNPGTPRRD